MCWGCAQQRHCHSFTVSSGASCWEVLAETCHEIRKEREAKAWPPQRSSAATSFSFQSWHTVGLSVGLRYLVLLSGFLYSSCVTISCWPVAFSHSLILSSVSDTKTLYWPLAFIQHRFQPWTPTPLPRVQPVVPSPVPKASAH